MTDQSRVVPSDVAQLSYERTWTEPAVAVERLLVTGGRTLAEALARWKRGEACQRRLSGARARRDVGAEHTQ